MKTWVWTIIAAPIGLLVIIFAVANRQPVTLSFDPFSTAAPALAITLPLYWLMFAALILGVVLGGVATWMKQGRWRRAARRNRSAAARAEREVADMKTQTKPAGPALPSPGGREAA